MDPTILYIGYAILGIIIFYIIVKILRFQLTIVEGLVDNTDKSPGSSLNIILKNIQNQNEKDKDVLLINKYLDDYNSLLVALEEWTNLKMINSVLKLNTNDGADTSKNLEIINGVNGMKSFKDNLNDIAGFLDSNTSKTNKISGYFSK